MTTVTFCATTTCARPADDGIVCRTCLSDLRKVLAETVWIMSELDVVIAKQTRYAAGGSKVTIKGGAKPLIANLYAARARADYAAKLALWTSDVSKSAAASRLAAARPGIAGAWLLAHLEAVRVHPAAGDLVDELCQAYATALYVIDRPMERRYLGECGFVYENVVCTEPLWARDGDEWATCRTCGGQWDAGVRAAAIRQQAVEGMEDRIMTATQAAETMVAYGITSDRDAVRLRDRIRKWAEQPRDPARRAILVKRIDLPTPGQRRRPGYRLGDIIELAHRIEAKRSA